MTVFKLQYIAYPMAGFEQKKMTFDLRIYIYMCGTYYNVSARYIVYT